MSETEALPRKGEESDAPSPPRPTQPRESTESVPAAQTQTGRKKDPIAAEKAIGQPRCLGVFVLEGFLGTGSYANVFRAHHMASKDQQVALKVFKKIDAELRPDQVVRRARETQIWSCLRHPNIVRYHEHFYVDRQRRVIVAEWLSGGSLEEHMQRRKFKALSEVQCRAIAYQLCLALEYLHANRVAHRDIKPDNLLHNNNGTVKLCDFGLSVLLEPTQQMVDVTSGTRSFMAPETLLNAPFDPFAVDMWAVGVCLFIFATGRHPFLVQRIPGDPTSRTMEYGPLSLPKASDGLKDLLSKLLTTDPSKRCKATEVLSHPFVDMPSKAPPAIEPRLEALASMPKSSGLEELSCSSHRSPRRSDSQREHQPVPTKRTVQEHRTSSFSSYPSTIATACSSNPGGSITELKIIPLPKACSRDAKLALAGVMTVLERIPHVNSDSLATLDGVDQTTDSIPSAQSLSRDGALPPSPVGGRITGRFLDPETTVVFFRVDIVATGSGEYGAAIFRERGSEAGVRRLADVVSAALAAQ